MLFNIKHNSVSAHNKPPQLYIVGDVRVLNKLSYHMADANYAAHLLINMSPSGTS